MNEERINQAVDSFAPYAPGPSGIAMKGISPTRRHELVQLAEQCLALFDTYKVTHNEKCFVGRLCQTLAEFTV